MLMVMCNFKLVWW